jgi:hypothetical protein
MSDDSSEALPRSAFARTRARAQRQTELDWLRGLMLVLMTITHLPTWFSAHVGQPFGFVSAAEGFVFLSAYLVGSVYSHIGNTRGYTAMRVVLWSRAAKVYAAHVALLLFLLFVLVPIAEVRGAHAITDLASFYASRPHTAVVTGLLLAYNPPLLDILPMYVVFLLLSPLVLAHGARRGWGALLCVSAALWLYAQVGGAAHLYQSVARLVEWPVPYAQTGAFSWLAWQLLWLAGLRAGALRATTTHAVGPPVSAQSRASLWTAAVLAATFFVWRHVTGQVPFGADAALNALFDKWHLGPLRLLNFVVLAVIVVHGRHVLAAWAERSSMTTLGRASLTVFSAHLVVCLLLLATHGDRVQSHPSLLEAGLLIGSLATLYAVARASLYGSKALRDRFNGHYVRPQPAVVDVNARAGR